MEVETVVQTAGDTPSITEPQPVSQEPVQPVVEVAQPNVNGEGVEPAVPEPIKPVVERPKASDFYGGRRKLRRLEEQVSSFSKMAEKLETLEKYITSTSKKPELSNIPRLMESPEDFEKYYLQRITDMAEQIERLKSHDVPELLKHMDEQKRLTIEARAATEILFPTSNSTETWQEVAAKNQDKVDAINEILDRTPGLEQMAREHPKEAAEIIMLKYAKAHPEVVVTPKRVTSELVPKKTQMGSTQSSINSTKGEHKMTVQDIQNQLKEFGRQISENPAILGDPIFKQQYAVLETELDKAIKEKEGK